MRRLLIATTNAHKTAEIRAILGPTWQVSDLSASAGSPAPEETGATFRENAVIKALAATEHSTDLVLADDSGLEVDALGGAPGVISARYAGAHASAEENRAKLLRELAEIGSPRRARFRCVIALAGNGAVLATFDGAVEGSIIEHERGKGGFGYDSLFVPDGHERTFAELPAALKNTISHRARALGEAAAFLQRS